MACPAPLDDGRLVGRLNFCSLRRRWWLRRWRRRRQSSNRSRVTSAGSLSSGCASVRSVGIRHSEVFFFQAQCPLCCTVNVRCSARERTVSPPTVKTTL